MLSSPPQNHVGGDGEEAVLVLKRTGVGVVVVT
jgi:hypothetical protein